MHLEIENSELREIVSSSGRYARFLKVDLHVHTPATPWCWNQKRDPGEPAAGDMTAVDVAKALVESDLDIVAITDHDTVGYVEKVIKEARRQSNKKKGRTLTVLPGVEITTYDGVHLLALFAVDKKVQQIHDMLIRFGLAADGVKSERADSGWPVDRVAAEVHKEGGLVIAPHALDAALGIWGGANSKHQGKRTTWVEGSIAPIWACRPDQIDKTKAALRAAGFDKTPAFIAHSDVHSYQELGTRATYIKLAEPTLQGLRQVIHEPALRVAYEPVPPPQHAHIIALELNGGYFENEVIVFSPHLNTLVGGNYAGKSAILDAIRFVFDDPCYDDEEEQQLLLDRIAGIYAAGAIKCWFRDEDGTFFRVERPVSIKRTTRSASTTFTANVQPVLTRLAGDTEVQEQAAPRDVLNVEMYGQGAVGSIARFEGRHRDLIDNLCGVAATARELRPSLVDVSTTLRPLADNAQEIADLHSSIVQIQTELNELEALKEEEHDLAAQAKNPVLQQWQTWQRANRGVRKARNFLDELDELMESGLDGASVLPRAPQMPRVQVAEADALLSTIEEEAEKVRVTTEAALKSLTVRARKGVTRARKSIDAWDAEHERKKDECDAELARTGKKSLKAVQTRLDAVREKIMDLEVRQELLQKYQTKITAKRDRRRRLRSDLGSKWDELRAQRKGMTDYLDGATGDELTIEYEQKGDKNPLATLLNAVLEKHATREASVKNREQQIALLVDAFEAEELADLCYTGDEEALRDKAGVTANTAFVLCNLSLEARLWLDMAPADDRVSIKYRRKGEKQHTDLRQLSPGERALALLSVAFATRGAPLIMDQPEDELGQLLVTSELVDTIRARKEKRQFILVTHNANIPVLGDAECIACVRNDSTEEHGPRCYVEDVGAIECPEVREVLLSLEGGRESFERRRAKYEITA